MTARLAAALTGLALLAACAAPPPPPVPVPEGRTLFSPVASAGQFQDAVVGRPIAFEGGSTMTFAPGGGVAGTSGGGAPLAGSWTWGAGGLCRAVAAGGAPGAPICGGVEVTESQIRLLTADGTLLGQGAFLDVPG